MIVISNLVMSIVEREPSGFRIAVKAALHYRLMVYITVTGHPFEGNVT